ncbi:MAG: glycosyltransferase [Bryobacterales bacterium]|nr:glycosyltransferase [Bryobacterales bacterium]
MNVSIIIPAYNAAGTIAETLESVVSQTFQDWEAIVVDDGSTDATADIAGAFVARDTRIRMVRQANGGEAAARNTGVSHTRHEWLVFLDSDDWISPLHLEKLTAELKAHPELDAAHGGSVRVAQDGTYVDDDYQAPVSALFPTLARRAAFPVHACIVRKALVEEVGKFDTSLQKSPDWDLWQRVARTGARFGAVREVLVYYRMAQNSSSLGAEQLLRDGLRVLRRGHTGDARVRNPHPDYLNGWQRDSVESQEFYLMCWCAGLLIGAGKDATNLMKAVEKEHYARLYPEGVARCIFEAATLPTCRTPEAWEKLWPKIHRRAEVFLTALEKQSQTPDLARQALPELKRMVLRHSASWGAVIKQDEEMIAKQRAAIDQLDSGRVRLEEDRGRLQREKETVEGDRLHWQRLAEEHGREKAAVETQLLEWRRTAAVAEQQKASLQDELQTSRDLGEALQRQKAEVEDERNRWQRSAEELEQQKVSLQDELQRTRELSETLQRQKAGVEDDRNQRRQRTEDHEIAIANLRGQTWVRLGARLGLLKQPGVGHARSEASETVQPAEYCEGEWQLRCEGGNSARLVISPGRPRMVRIDIAKAETKTPWDIQLNQAPLKVKATHRYTLRFWARADKRRGVGVGCARAESPWTNLGLYERVTLKRRWQHFELDFTAAENDDNARIHFDAGGSGVAVELSSVSLQGSSDGHIVKTGVSEGAEETVESSAS